MLNKIVAATIKYLEKTMNKGITPLQAGDKAPDFVTKNEFGEEVRLKDYLGRKVILYFYPKDDTTGCTAESCNLRDNYSELKEKGYEVLGVSNDSERSHQKFIKKYNLPFTLLADTDKELVGKYGVFGEKILFGKPSLGIWRTTFVIDEKGFIEKVITEVDTVNHTEQLLK